jgi:tetratricopeptide (TPR) repeat protein
MKRTTLFLLAISWMSPQTFAQSIDIGKSTDVGTVVELDINVSVDSAQNTAPAGLNVQLYDPSGNDSMSQGSQRTDSGGRAVFRTTSGVHQFRVTGEGIEDYVGTVQIVRQQARAVENVTVKSKPSSGRFGIVPPGSSGIVSASRYNIPDKAAKEFKAGSKALESKDYAEAKKRFANATSIYAEYSVAYNGMGVAQMASSDTTGARTSFEKAIQIDPSFAEAYRNLARISLADHNFAELDDLLIKSLQSDPLNAWALTYAAYAELQLNKFDLAIAHARAAHAVPHPGLASVHIVAAHALEATNQPSEALKEYRLYLNEDPNGRDAARAKQAVASLSSTEPK